jgi:thiamine kinase-like enzyme
MTDLDRILTRLEPALGPRSGAAVPLDGGITNRNFRVHLGERDYVVRLNGVDTALLGISRHAERMAGATAARLGIAPALAAVDDEGLVTAYVDGCAIDEERLRREPAPVARALRAFHDSGVQLPVRFWVPQLLDDYAAIVADRGVELPPEYDQVRRLARRIGQALPLHEPVPCHDDLLAGNLLQGPDGVLLVDWEYAGMGHRLFDLGNLAVNNGFDDAAEERLLTAYHGNAPTAGALAGLKLMRIMSDAREAAWGVIQGAISGLEFDFAGYAQSHFDRLGVAMADRRLEGWFDAAST